MDSQPAALTSRDDGEQRARAKTAGINLQLPEAGKDCASTEMPNDRIKTRISALNSGDCIR